MDGSHDPFIFAPDLQNDSDTLNPIHYNIAHDADETLRSDLYDPLLSYHTPADDAEIEWSNLQLMFTGMPASSSSCSNYSNEAMSMFQQSFLSQQQVGCIIPEIEGPNNHLLSTATTTSERLQELGEAIPERTTEPAVRMTKQSIRALKEWKSQHGDTAKPTTQQIRRLQTQTNLSPEQIQNWFAHSKRRNESFGVGHKQGGGGGMLNLLSSESPIPSAVMNIPKRPPTPIVRDVAYTPPTPFGDMCPMERWENSPPEHEAALVSDIAKALSHSDIHYTSSKSRASTRSASRGDSVSTGSSLNGRHRDPSESSIDSEILGSIAWSDNSGQSTHSSTKSGTEYRRRARKRRTNPLLQGSKSLRGDIPKTYQCTFCTDSFKTKYDWSRHEKSLHLALESWTCSPFGSTDREPDGSQPTCAYCNIASPTEEHLHTHRYLACDGRPVSERTYYRKDHLRQHLRLVHGCRFIPGMEKWKHTPEYVRSRCGFCDKHLTTWQDRIDHLAGHFREGDTMANWSGGWGFEPHILLLIENGMPPFLIHHERNTVAPFSGTISSSKKQNNNQERTEGEGTTSGAKLKLYSNQYTYPDTQEISWYECFESQLVTYINATLAEEGRLPSDKEIQDQGRRFVYDGDDPWHQTIAENAMWLEDFRQRYGFVDLGNVG